MVVARALPVSALQAGAIVKLRYGRDDGATVAPRPEILGRVEAETAEHADRPGAAARGAAAMGLASVLDHVDTSLAGHFEDGIEIDCSPEQVHGDHTTHLG